MTNSQKFYINGEWVQPSNPTPHDVVNPATEQPCGQVMLGNAEDVDKAVSAARAALKSYARTSKDERIALLSRIRAAYEERHEELAQTISAEVGAPLALARKVQVAMVYGHIDSTIELLKGYEFREQKGNITIAREPIGVCGLITPWNWPLNQIACKVFPALAAGCTMILKPSEVAPLNAVIFAEVLDAAGVPAGVFNLVNGDGPTVGNAMSSHPGIDMMSFTGSTRAGIQVAKSAADSVKRVAQELGGKSPNIILEDADLEKAVAGGVGAIMLNSGQSCNAPSRMLVPRSRIKEATDIARRVAESTVAGDPGESSSGIGPVVNRQQFDRIQNMIQAGIDEGANLVTGGTGLPDGLDKGYFVKPTIFTDVSNDMHIAREEIFGPVLCLLPYDDIEEAIEMANDTVYGLAAYVSGSDQARVEEVASRLEAGSVHINGAGPDFQAPFGGYKQSGNGREWGVFGLEEFLEVKAILRP